MDPHPTPSRLQPARQRHHHARTAGSAASASIHVRDLAQMFNSLDPSPFGDRDLDRAAAEFIEEEFREKRSAEVWHLHVFAQEGVASVEDLQTAVESYYGRLASSARNAMREHVRMAELALVGGLLIFLLAMGAREILKTTLGVLPPTLNEGLIILAWLALWRPAEALVYEWVPLYRKRRLYERLAGIHVTVRMSTAGTPGAVQPAPSVPQASHSTRPAAGKGAERVSALE